MFDSSLWLFAGRVVPGGAPSSHSLLTTLRASGSRPAGWPFALLAARPPCPGSPGSCRPAVLFKHLAESPGPGLACWSVDGLVATLPGASRLAGPSAPLPGPPSTPAGEPRRQRAGGSEAACPAQHGTQTGAGI